MKAILFALENGRNNFMNNKSNILCNNIIGWFAIALSKEVKCNQSIQVMLASTPYLVSRSQTGIVKLNNKTQNIREQNGIIYAWNHPEQLEPTWHIPLLDETGWSAFRYHQITAKTHPQEVYENGIDTSHFPVVHSFKQVTSQKKPIFENHNMTVEYSIHRNFFLSLKKLLFVEFEVSLHGLGCAYTHIHVQAYGMRIRMFTLTTPTYPGEVKIRLAVAISKNIKIPFKHLLLPMLHWIIQKNIIHDFCQDIPIWENKCYRPIPLLVKGDGDIIKYRRWCQQFMIKE
jgi:hypothetical protein